MSIRVMTNVWDNGPDQQGHLLIMLALADWANDEGECWPSVKKIAEKARMSERGVQKIIRILEAQGWLKIETGNGRKGCNRYMINPEPYSPPELSSPRTRAHKTPNTGAETLNGGSPEPSRTIKEPSVKRKTRIPQNGVISNSMIEIAEREGHTIREAQAQYDRFKDSCLANGRMYLDWDAAWRNWLRSPYFKPITNGGHHERPNQHSKAAQRSDAALEQIARLAGIG